MIFIVFTHRAIKCCNDAIISQKYCHRGGRYAAMIGWERFDILEQENQR
jgi:hypothetical protein